MFLQGIDIGHAHAGIFKNRQSPDDAPAVMGMNLFRLRGIFFFQ